MVRMISWNIARQEEAWRFLIDTKYDIALLQEASEPPADIVQRISVDPGPWLTAGAGLNRPWRAAIVKLTNHVGVKFLETKPIELADHDEIAVSRGGTIAAAIVTPPNVEPFIIASIYAPWERPHRLTRSNWIYADGSVHRIISDLSAFVGQQVGQRILIAGDLNILHGYGEQGNAYWVSRYATVFNRLESLGLSFVGPQSPDGHLADPWPEELPKSSKNVPTYYSRQQNPSTATRQLDFVFASHALMENVQVRAINDPEQWGPSDHCRIEIDILQ